PSPCCSPLSLHDALPIFILELTHALDGACHQRPGELLMRQPLAALDGIHEVALDRVALVQGNVVAALDHPCAATLPEQPLRGDGDRKSTRLNSSHVKISY